MDIIVVSHKETWISSASPSGFATVGGFPIQIRALSVLFEKTVAAVTLRDGPAPPHSTPIGGNSVTVMPLPEPAGRGLARKISLFPWLLRNGTPMWRRISDADAVHALVPGDVGFLGLLLAVVRRKPLFIRHCGT